MRALLGLAGTNVADDDLAQIALEAETIELGIQAGLQDRIVQARGGLVSMDFATGDHEDLDAALLPPMYLAWCTDASEHSGVVHDDLRGRFDRGDSAVIGAMQRLAGHAAQAHAGVMAADASMLGAAIDASFDERAAILELDPRHVAMVSAARAVGASANYAGSGGAIIGTLPHPEAFADLEDALGAVGATAIRPLVTPPRAGVFEPPVKELLLTGIRASAFI
jgi:glucuronokinase